MKFQFHVFGESEGEDTDQRRNIDESVFERGRQCGGSSRRSTDTSGEGVTGGGAAHAERFKFNNGEICWSSVAPDAHGRAATPNDPWNPWAGSDQNRGHQSRF